MKKLDPILNKDGKPITLSMDVRVCVGFGPAYLQKDGEVVWEERGQDPEDCLTVQECEDMASKEPDADWRIIMIAPLEEGYWQRQGPNEWVLYEEGDGFA